MCVKTQRTEHGTIEFTFYPLIVTDRGPNNTPRQLTYTLYGNPNNGPYTMNDGKIITDSFKDE